MNPLVSVIIPVFRVEKYLIDCVESVLNQTLENYEIILVDDGSDDYCPAICDNYALKYEKIHTIHQTNQGSSNARNNGISQARGEYIAFCDSDDMMRPEMLKKMYTTAIKNDVDIVMCGYESFPYGKIVSPKVKKNTVLKPMDFINSSTKIHSDNDLCFSVRFLFRKALIDRKSVRFNERISFGEDFLFNLTSLMESNRIIVISDPLYLYRVNNENSIMRSRYKENLEQKISIQYQEKKKLSNKYGLDKNMSWQNDMADYYAYNFSRMLFSNAMNSPDPNKKKQIKQLINLPALRENFVYCHDNNLLFLHGIKNGLFHWTCWARLYNLAYLYIIKRIQNKW